MKSQKFTTEGTEKNGSIYEKHGELSGRFFFKKFFLERSNGKNSIVRIGRDATFS